jgi:hypothetical protein
MTQNLLTAAPSQPAAPSAPSAARMPQDAGGVPPGSPPAVPPMAVPAKFLDPATGQVRVDALLKSYLELERKLSQMMPMPGPEMGDAERRRMLAALGVPEGPEGYRVDCPHGLFEPDPELNGRMHKAGFTPDQVQLVYDLAAERMVPLIQEVAAEFEAERELERLVEYFGGEDRWRETSRQMLAWARKNLPATAVEGLSSSFDGVLALYRMMSSDEPAAMRPGTGAPAGESESELTAMIRDPRYWRDKDPAFIAKVTEGFRRLFPGEKT